MKETLVDGERSRALAILAENPGGCTRAVMLGRGLPLALIDMGVAFSHLMGVAFSRLEDAMKEKKPSRDARNRPKGFSGAQP